MHELTLFQRFRIGQADRSAWYQALQQTSKDGLKFFDVLTVMATEFNKTRDPMLPVVLGVMDRQRGKGAGDSRSVTVAQTLSGYVPQTEVVLIEAGETSKGLDVGFQQAVTFVGRMSALVDAVRKPLVEPAGLFVMLVFVAMVMSVVALPQYATLVKFIHWPKHAQLYGNLADHILLVAGGAVGLLLALIAGWRHLQNNWTGERRIFFDRHVFPFSLSSNVEAASLLTALAGFVEAGVNITVAIERLGQNATPYMKWIYSLLHEQLTKGESPAEALKALHIVPAKVHWMLRVYGKTNNFESAMNGIAETLIEVTIKRVQGIFNTVSLLLKLTIAMYFIWSVASFFGIANSAKKQSSVAMSAPVVELSLVSGRVYEVCV